MQLKKPKSLYVSYVDNSHDEGNTGQQEGDCSHTAPVLVENTDCEIHISFPHSQK